MITAAPAPAARTTGHVPPQPWSVALAASVASGVALLLAFPPYDLWWLAPIGVGLLALATRDQRPRTGALYGAISGLVFFVPLLSWTSIEIGPAPWWLLAGLQATFFALLGAALAAITPLLQRWPASWPLLTALLWVAQEALRSRFPVGGFPWGRLAFSQQDSPMLALAAIGGAPLVSFAVALVGALLAAVLWRRWPIPRNRVIAALWPAPVALLVALAGLAVPAATPTGQPVNVAVVQGNVPRLGLDFNAQRRAVLDNHVNATIDLADEVAAGRQPPPDLVIWPENSSDIDPIRHGDAGERIQQAAAAIGAPILVGAIVHTDGEVRNVGLVWDPVTGPDQMYSKRHPVPFAEYWPWEPVVYPIARAITDAAELVAGFTAGQQPGVLAMGPATVGNVICFEVAYDDLVRDTVTHGGQLLAVQTNNATFNEAEARQQLAMVRLRAVEHGQWSLMASTVGISGFVDTHGTVYDETGFFTPDVRVRTLVLSERRTVATTLGAWPEGVLAIAAGAALLASAWWRRHERHSDRKRGDNDRAAA